MLDAPVADSRDRAVRWRQLVDLLSRSGGPSVSEQQRQALELVGRDAFAVEEEVRAATVRAIAGRTIGADLLKILAAQPVRVAAPIFAGLTLGAAEAEDILADASLELRSLVSVIRAEAEPPAPAPSLPTVPSIGEMVDRIERLQRERTSFHPSEPALAPRADPGPAVEARLFEWESDATGHIAWVEGAPRGALVGRPLGGDGVGLLERHAVARLAQRHPFVDVPLAVDEVLPGAWSGTGVPAFDPATGRFLGYRGVARRTDGSPRQTPAPREPDLDALRELVHEIKTPLNAIIGFAEIIDGQYLGPAHRLYRERAAGIVHQARQLLEAVEDLDLAAKLRAERATKPVRQGSSLAELMAPISAELEICLAAGGGTLEVEVDDKRNRCILSSDLVIRLVRRLLLSLCRSVGAGEIFRIAVSRQGALCQMTVARPRILAGLSEAQLVDPAFNPAGLAEHGDGEDFAIGLGFAMRLVRGLAKVAGGGLRIDEHRITLELPAADE